MIDLDISFEQSPWQAFLMTKQAGDTVSAAQMLAMLEDAEEQAFEDALSDLETACMVPDISDLPKNSGVGEAAVRLRQEMQLAKKDLHSADLETGDPLRLYLDEVADTPVCGDESVFAESCAGGEEGAAEALTNLGLRRVIDLAREHTGYGVLLLDLIQEGNLGLWQGVQYYHGGDYAAHRDRWIRFYMARAVIMQARANGVGQKMRTAMEDYRAVDERLLGELGRNPTLEEIAQELHMTTGETEAVQNMLENARILAQTQKAPEPEEEAEEENQAVENTALFQMRQRIGDLLSELTETDRRILTLRFGLEGGQPLGSAEIGRRLGLTTEETAARETAALAKLRAEG